MFRGQWKTHFGAHGPGSNLAIVTDLLCDRQPVASLVETFLLGYMVFTKVWDITELNHLRGKKFFLSFLSVLLIQSRSMAWFHTDVLLKIL